MLADIDEDDYRRYVEASKLVAKRVDLAPGASGLIINGRVRLFVVRPSISITLNSRVFRSLARLHPGNSPQRTIKPSKTMSWQGVSNLY